MLSINKRSDMSILEIERLHLESKNKKNSRKFFPKQKYELFTV